MAPSVSLRKRLCVGGLAAGGVVAGHAGAYMLAAPDPVRRHGLLAETGHGAWAVLVPIAMGALMASLVGFAAGRLRAPPPAPDAPLLRETARRLVPLQLGAFLVLEAIERLASGHDITELPGEPVIAIGLAVQAVVALAGAALLALCARVVDRLGRVLAEIHRAPRVLAAPGALAIAFPRSGAARGPASPRGPPMSRL
jgi:hypothetical protein